MKILLFNTNQIGSHEPVLASSSIKQEITDLDAYLFSFRGIYCARTCQNSERGDLLILDNFF